MEKKKRRKYEAPMTKSMEFKSEKILCLSGGDYDAFHNGGSLF